MPLKIELKPGEKLIVGNALITNDSERTRIFIEGDVPILRERYILGLAQADTPCKKVYYLVLEMYLARDPSVFHAQYFERVKEILQAAPSLLRFIDPISERILENDYYAALKAGILLIDEEARMLSVARGQA